MLLKWNTAQIWGNRTCFLQVHYSNIGSLHVSISWGISAVCMQLLLTKIFMWFTEHWSLRCVTWQRFPSSATIRVLCTMFRSWCNLFTFKMKAVKVSLRKQFFFCWPLYKKREMTWLTGLSALLQRRASDSTWPASAICWRLPQAAFTHGKAEL